MRGVEVGKRQRKMRFPRWNSFVSERLLQNTIETMVIRICTYSRGIGVVEKSMIDLKKEYMCIGYKGSWIDKQYKRIMKKWGNKWGGKRGFREKL